VQNAVARLVLQLDHRTPVKPALQRLHWLPVKARIEFKITTLMHAILRQREPAYLSNMVQYNTADSGCRQLRSSTTPDCNDIGDQTSYYNTRLDKSSICMICHFVRVFLPRNASWIGHRSDTSAYRPADVNLCAGDIDKTSTQSLKLSYTY